jgi:hypothetical protein
MDHGYLGTPYLFPLAVGVVISSRCGSRLRKPIRPTDDVATRFGTVIRYASPCPSNAFGGFVGSGFLKTPCVSAVMLFSCWLALLTNAHGRAWRAGCVLAWQVVYKGLLAQAHEVDHALVGAQEDVLPGRAARRATTSKPS